MLTLAIVLTVIYIIKVIISLVGLDSDIDFIDFEEISFLSISLDGLLAMATFFCWSMVLTSQGIENTIIVVVISIINALAFGFIYGKITELILSIAKPEVKYILPKIGDTCKVDYTLQNGAQCIFIIGNERYDYKVHTNDKIQSGDILEVTSISDIHNILGKKTEN
ncbi:MAG: hypothetical protein ACK5LT_03380 [Lachnospirales bacterium]